MYIFNLPFKSSSMSSPLPRIQALRHVVTGWGAKELLDKSRRGKHASVSFPWVFWPGEGGLASDRDTRGREALHDLALDSLSGFLWLTCLHPGHMGVNCEQQVGEAWAALMSCFLSYSLFLLGE